MSNKAKDEDKKAEDTTSVDTQEVSAAGEPAADFKPIPEHAVAAAPVDVPVGEPVANAPEEEGVNLVSDLTALTTAAAGKVDRLMETGLKFQQFVRENETKFRRIESIQQGYNTLKEVSDDLSKIIDLAKIDALTKQLEDALASIQRKEATGQDA